MNPKEKIIIVDLFGHQPEKGKFNRMAFTESRFRKEYQIMTEEK